MIEGRAVSENEGCIIGSKGREEGCISCYEIALGE